MDITPYLELVPAPRVVFEQAAARGDRPRFFVPEGDTWRPISWRAYAEAVEGVAAFLVGEGLAVGDRVAIFAPNRVEWIEAALGIEAAGGVLVPIYPSSTAEQAAYVIEHADAKWVFVDGTDQLARLLELELDVRLVALDDALDVSAAVERSKTTFASAERSLISWSSAHARGRPHRDAARARLAGIGLEHDAIMLYTSGTSGRPKGVPLTHRNLSCNLIGWLEACAPLLDEGAKDVFWLPMSHIFGYGEATIGNLLGFESYLSSPARVLEDLPRVRPQVFMSVPSYWEKLAASEDLATATGGRLAFCLSGGAGLDVKVKERFRAAGVLIIEGYGLTETSPTLTLNRADAYRFDSVGRALSNVELKLAEDGEILARGENVFRGYHRDPEATAAAFTEDGWFKTGDVGRFTEDGFLQIIDRKKDILVSSGGKNIAPANIEVLFRADPLIEHLVVYGDAKKYLVAGVWLRSPATEAEIAARIEAVNAKLARHETIKRFAIMETPLSLENELLTPTLKLRRKKVYEAFRARFEALYA